MESVMGAHDATDGSPRVTVSQGADASAIGRAERVAAATGLPFVRRPGSSAGVAVVVEVHGAKLVVEGRAQPSHPGIALVRVKRMRQQGGAPDRLVDAGGIVPGDTVFDGTFGFGQDALVLAEAVGPSGRVVAVERSPVLVALALAGMPGWDAPSQELVPRIDVRVADHRDVLAAMPDRSVDVVCLDPMFFKVRASQPGFDALRAFADHAPLTADTLAHAVRVARRRVVVKDGADGDTLQRLKIRPHPGKRWARVFYGVVHCD